MLLLKSRLVAEHGVGHNIGLKRYATEWRLGSCATTDQHGTLKQTFKVHFLIMSIRFCCTQEWRWLH